MGFISNLLNVESADFKSISKPTAIKEFVEENDNVNRLYELLAKLKNDSKKIIVNKEIKAMKRGLQGERTVDFELRNCMTPFLYLHDIRLEYDNLNAQIDYLLITKKYICVIETKQLLGDVNINDDGDFIRVYKNKNGYENKECMSSPIEQNKKHVNLIKKILKDVFDCDNVPIKSLVIMANPKAIIRKKYAPEDIQNQIIRAEKLGNYIEELENEFKKAVFKEEVALKIANYFKEKHIPINIDYEAKFAITEEDFSKADATIKTPRIDYEPSIEMKEIEADDNNIEDKSSLLNEDDDELLKKLKLYRNEKAKEEGYSGLKYHYVFSGSTMSSLVEIKPQTTEELFQVKGLGEVKINKYGNDILNIIKEHVLKIVHLNEENLSETCTDNEEQIRNKLKKFRLETAKKDQIKPFMIFKDEQIEELINVKPKNKEQLLKVKGFGEIKVQKYGEEIINIIINKNEDFISNS